MVWCFPSPPETWKGCTSCKLHVPPQTIFGRCWIVQFGQPRKRRYAFSSTECSTSRFCEHSTVPDDPPGIIRIHTVCLCAYASCPQTSRFSSDVTQGRRLCCDHLPNFVWKRFSTSIVFRGIFLLLLGGWSSADLPWSEIQAPSIILKCKCSSIMNSEAAHRLP